MGRRQTTLSKLRSENREVIHNFKHDAKKIFFILNELVRNKIPQTLQKGQGREVRNENLKESFEFVKSFCLYDIVKKR